MMRYAAIDIGTNSMRLLLAEMVDKQIVKREKEINTTRIGSAVDENGFISEEGILRNLEGLKIFVDKARAFGAASIEVIGTSALRDAKNGGDFVKRAKEAIDVDVKVIHGEEEARLGYLGVAKGIEEDLYKMNPEEHLLVVDIGGGSTELILGKGLNLEKTISLNVGAVRMTERHLKENPPSIFQQEQMEEDILGIVLKAVEEMKKEMNPDLKPRFIGIGGTITSLAALQQELEPYDGDKVHNYRLTLEDIRRLKKNLSSLTVDQIRNLKGIHPKRADIILAGVSILIILMENLYIYEIVVSEYDNLEGLLFPRT